MDTPPAENSPQFLKRSMVVVLAFGAGALAHALFSRSRSPAEVAEIHGTPAFVVGPPPQIPAAMVPRAGQAATRVEDDSARWLRLQPEVVDALLTGGGLDRKLGLMGLTAEQVAIVTRIQDEATAALKRIEKDHASVVSDERGDFVVISPFPEEKRGWLNQIDEKLRAMVGDDRASVISRMIAFSDNDEAIGSGRREIFIIEPPAPGQKLRIEERTFNAAGEHIDTDYAKLCPHPRTKKYARSHLREYSLQPRPQGASAHFGLGPHHFSAKKLTMTAPRKALPLRVAFARVMRPSPIQDKR